MSDAPCRRLRPVGILETKEIDVMRTRLLPLMVIAALCPESLADVITVNADGTADFRTIQEGIDFALPGDEVLVEPGDYTETIDFLGKNITVRGVLGPDVTSIKAPAGAAGSTVTFAAKENTLAVLDGFKIGGGTGNIINDPIFGPSLAGGGIFCYESCPRILNCDIVGESVDGHGAGMLVMRCSPDIVSCRFLNGTAQGHGGAIYILEGASPQIENCLFDGNRASWGGAITCTIDCDPILTGCSFVGNEAFNVGGALYIRSRSDPLIRDCSFTGNIQSGNVSAGGAAITIYGSGNLGGPCLPIVDGCILEDNVCDGYGGAIHAAYSGNVILRDCVIRGNRSGRNGGGIALVGNAAAPTDVSVSGCEISDNASQELGGGIDVRSSTITIDGCLVRENRSASGAGPESGGGCSFQDGAGSVVTDSMVCGNLPDQVLGSYTDGGGNTIDDDCPSGCLADVTEDGVVDGADLTALLGFWGACSDPADCSADLDGDGVIDGADLTALLGEWGSCR